MKQLKKLYAELLKAIRESNKIDYADIKSKVKVLSSSSIINSVKLSSKMVNDAISKNDPIEIHYAKLIYDANLYVVKNLLNHKIATN